MRGFDRYPRIVQTLPPDYTPRMSYKIQRFPITQEDITRVMDRFYARIRIHPVLGPVFAAHIGDTNAEWAAHIARIDSFWARAFLGKEDYVGNPMAAHVGNPLISVDHFPIWLELFEATLTEELPPETAAAWGAMAHRIARGFRMAMENHDADIPALR